jgi:hypothetical protein
VEGILTGRISGAAEEGVKGEYLYFRTSVRKDFHPRRRNALERV